MEDPEDVDLRLRLARAQRSAPVALRDHLQTHWPGRTLADLDPEAATGALAFVLRGLPEPEEDDLRRDRRWLQGGADRTLLPFTDPRYPGLLREIPDPPLALFIRGRHRHLVSPCVSIVGARNATPQGRESARSFARELAGRGLVVVSGLARGIDGWAHRGALEAGASVGVCAHGLDSVYPPAHRSLADELAVNGALVSEFPPGTRPLKRHFPLRNRLISGMSLGTVVIEAGLRSGSLITARLAAEQNREVLAVPGSIQSPQSRGCHALIKKGVTLVESVEDILQEIDHPGDHSATEIAPVRDSPVENGHARFLEHVGYAPCTRDELVKRSGLTSAEVSSMLLTLELEGCVELCPGGAYVRVNRS